MSTTVFTLSVARPYDEHIAHETLRQVAQGGREVRLALLPAQGLFVVSRATLPVSPARNTIAAIRSFWDARQGGYDSFLYKAVLTEYKKVTGEALGTGDGSEDEFALDSKYIDSANLTVYIDGASQSSGWALTGNNTAPIVDFVTPPANGEVVTADYEFYYPCRFDQDRMPGDLKSLAATDANSIIKVSSLTWRQDWPGSHLV